MFKLRGTIDNCYNSLNRNVLDLLCHFVSSKYSEYFYQKDFVITAKIQKEWLYQIIKNCFDTLKSFCLIFKFLQHLTKQSGTFDQFLNLLPQETLDLCRNELVICVNDYSNVSCSEDFKVKLLQNFLNSSGLVLESNMEQIIKYFLYQ